MTSNPKNVWMDTCNQLLLLRLWERKGRPGTFRLKTPYGTSIDHVNTPYGVLTIMRDPVLYDTQPKE